MPNFEGVIPTPAVQTHRPEQLLWVLSAAMFLIFFQAYMIAPLIPKLADMFHVSPQAVYIAATDFIFAGDSGKPRWQGIMMTDHVKPAAQRAAIGRNIGWHTFRHMFSSILHNAGTNMAVQKELLRHADISTTMNMYTQAVNPTSALC
jgi:integrase